MYEQRIIKLQIGELLPRPKCCNWTHEGTAWKQNERKSIQRCDWAPATTFRFSRHLMATIARFRVHKATRNYYQLNGPYLMWASHASRGPWPMGNGMPRKWANIEWWMDVHLRFERTIKYVRRTITTADGLRLSFRLTFLFSVACEQEAIEDMHNRQFHELFSVTERTQLMPHQMKWFHLPEHGALVSTYLIKIVPIILCD